LSDRRWYGRRDDRSPLPLRAFVYRERQAALRRFVRTIADRSTACRPLAADRVPSAPCQPVRTGDGVMAFARGESRTGGGDRGSAELPDR